ncbi:WH2 domain-containing protein [Entamoeba marina]
MSNKQTDIKTKEEMAEIEKSTSLTQSQIKNILPNYRKLADACDSYFKAELSMIKATDTLATSLGGLAECGHPDLEVGVKNMANVLEMWKANLTEVADQFKNTTLTIRGDVTQLPKELEKLEKDTKTNKSKCQEELKKANKEVEKISKNKKTMAKDPTALVNAMKTVTEKESASQHVSMGCLKDSLNLMRMTYGQLFECFKRVFVTKINSDEQSQQIINAQMKDMDMLIKKTKTLPQKFRGMTTMKKQSMINTSWLSPQLKSILKDAGVKPRHLANPDIVDTLINTVKIAVDEGKVSSELLEQLQQSRSNKEDKVGKVVDINEFSAPQNKPPPPPVSTDKPAEAPTSSTTTKPKRQPPPSAPVAAKPQKQTNTPTVNVTAPPVEDTAPKIDTSAPPPPELGAPPPPPPMNMPPPPPVTNNVSTAGNPPPPPPSKPSQSSAPAQPRPSQGPSFLDSINKGGFALKKAEDREIPNTTSDAGASDLTSMLRKAMEVRRNDIADDEDEDDDDWDDEWDD